MTAMRDFSKQKGFHLVTVVLPSLYRFQNYPFAEIHEQLHAFFIGEEIAYIDMLPELQLLGESLYWVSPHLRIPNAQGHKQIARGITEFLIDHLPFAETPSEPE